MFFRGFSLLEGKILQLGSWIMILTIFEALLAAATVMSASERNLQLIAQDKYAVMANGILRVTISVPEGMVTGIQYNGISNLLETRNGENNRGYWDLVWKIPGKISKRKKGTVDRIQATKFKVILENDEQIELSFARTWDLSLQNGTVPLNIDKRYVMLRGSSGFYTYAIFERLEGWPAFEIENIRLAFKLNKDKFDYMAISEEMRRKMPMPDDRLPGRGRTLAYPEAVLLVRPIEPEFLGEVDDKYQYSSESKDIKVHGWISSGQAVGFWQITPSNEFRSAGPTKQFLSSHVGPTNLGVFHRTHYTGADLIMKFEKDEPWKKVFGPVFVYLNSLRNNGDLPSLWEDAKKQMQIETQSWPYKFPASVDFPAPDQRGKVNGRLLIADRFFGDQLIPANGSYVGLALPGDVGSWQRECKGYQFWTNANSDGRFNITDIREGEYNLYAWVPGFIGDYKYNTTIKVTACSETTTSDLVYKPPRDGLTLWEIGSPDRSAAEFYIPDPNPLYINRLYQKPHQDRFRQYGLWEKYTELYPDADLVFTVGVDDYSKDWFFAQVTRAYENNGYKGTTWQIEFKLEKLDARSTYKLRVAVAAANVAELQIRMNDPRADPPLFTSGQIGQDNAIARHGVHGLYWLYNVDVPGKFLREGHNSLFLTQPLSQSPFQGLMYDYIRLEGPSFSE